MHQAQLKGTHACIHATFSLSLSLSHLTCSFPNQLSIFSVAFNDHHFPLSYSWHWLFYGFWPTEKERGRWKQWGMGWKVAHLWRILPPWARAECRLVWPKRDPKSHNISAISRQWNSLPTSAKDFRWVPSAKCCHEQWAESESSLFPWHWSQDSAFIPSLLCLPLCFMARDNSLLSSLVHERASFAPKAPREGESGWNLKQGLGN